MKGLVAYILICFLFISCAQVVAPTGGLKDTTPPEALVIEPENFSTNFTSETFEIEFDEYVRLNQLNDELVVSPPLKNKLETSIKGKKIIVVLDDTLKENTTYVFNFGNAIVDVNEGNKLENFQYVFSTGNFIDSLTLSGSVVDAFSLAPEEAMLVMLYNETKNDSIPYQELPTYIGRTNKKGQFTITNIAAGEYKLFALLDGNKNYLFDRPTEKIGFISQPLNISKPIDSLKIYAFEEAMSKQFVEKQEINGNSLMLSFNEPLDSFSYKGIDTNLNSILITQQLTAEKDSAIFWWKEANDVKLRMQVNDGEKFTDTISFKIDSISQKSKLKLTSTLSKKHPYFKAIPLKFNRPIKSIDTALIQLFNSDSTKVDYTVKIDSSNGQLLLLNFEAIEDSSYILSILPNAFIDIYNRTTDSISSKIVFDKPSDYGELAVKVNTNIPTIARVIQLTDAKGEMLREKSLIDFKATFSHLKPGKYRLKVIVDENNNGEWDPGNYLEGKQAERVILYNEDISIRSNWDQEIEWILK